MGCFKLKSGSTQGDKTVPNFVKMPTMKYEEL